MGLDIYAGALTRYYARNWKTVTQKWAEESGMEFQTIRPNEEEAEEIPVDVIQEQVREWCGAIAEGLSSAEGAFEAWEEDNEKDYYTDKPDWAAFGALLLYGACQRYDLPLPGKIEKSWDFQKDPVVARAFADEEFNWSLFSHVEWWLPFEGSFSFRAQAPNGNEIAMGTTGGLLLELRKINERGWNADEAAILEWSKTEGYPADAEVVDGVYKKIADNDEFDVQSLAKFAFSILYQAALFSEKHRVPILLDY